MIRIVKQIEASDVHRRADALDAIFFETAGTKDFASPEARAAYRERWLGRYLTLCPDWVFLALNDQDAILGYVIGSLDDPARTAVFDDIAYLKNFADETAMFPAHLHINLTEPGRGLGIGRALVEAFAQDAALAGSPGVHVVTGADQPNVAFYKKIGFDEAARTKWNGKTLLFLARALSVRQ